MKSWVNLNNLKNPRKLCGSGRVLFVTGDVSLVVEGLHITGGDATGLGGGPLGVDAGGGVCVLSTALTFRGSQVLSNAAERGGGLSA